MIMALLSWGLIFLGKVRRLCIPTVRNYVGGLWEIKGKHLLKQYKTCQTKGDIAEDSSETDD